MSSTKESRDISRQRLWPLFVVALSLVAFGFYFVFFTETGVRKPEGQQARKISVDPEVPADLGLPGAPPLLRYENNEQTRRFLLERSTETVEETGDGVLLQTRIELNVHDRPVESTDGIVFDRSYSDVAVSVLEDGLPVGEGITHEVERLLESARHRVTLEKNGRLEDFELTSSQAAQLRQTLDILQDGFELLTPRFPREEVNVGETWTYEMRFRVSPETGRLSLDGVTKFESRFEGVGEDGFSVLSQALDGRASGTFRREDAQDSEPFEAQGRGKAVFRFDTEIGGVARGEMRYQQTMRFPQSGAQLRSVMELKSFSVPETDEEHPIP